jgi:hypothetical protein
VAKEERKKERKDIESLTLILFFKQEFRRHVSMCLHNFCGSRTSHALDNLPMYKSLHFKARIAGCNAL